MAQRLRIRSATQDDLAEVNRVLVTTWHDTYDSLIGREKVDKITSKWHAMDVLARQLDAPDNSFLVAEIGNVVVGHALTDAQRARVLFLARLYVLPSHQRQGIGKALLAAAIKCHPSTSKVRVNVEADNAKGVQFYRRQRFAVLGDSIEGGMKTLHMEKAIGTNPM